MQGKAAKDNKEFYLTAILSVVGLALDENIPCNAKEVRRPLEVALYLYCMRILPAQANCFTIC